MKSLLEGGSVLAEGSGTASSRGGMILLEGDRRPWRRFIATAGEEEGPVVALSTLKCEVRGPRGAAPREWEGGMVLEASDSSWLSWGGWPCEFSFCELTAGRASCSALRWTSSTRFPASPRLSSSSAMLTSSSL